jgi:hypothetical protein
VAGKQEHAFSIFHLLIQGILVRDGKSLGQFRLGDGDGFDRFGDGVCEVSVKKIPYGFSLGGCFFRKGMQQVVVDYPFAVAYDIPRDEVEHI